MIDFDLQIFISYGFVVEGLICLVWLYMWDSFMWDYFMWDSFMWGSFMWDSFMWDSFMWDSFMWECGTDGAHEPAPCPRPLWP